MNKLSFKHFGPTVAGSVCILVSAFIAYGIAQGLPDMRTYTGGTNEETPLTDTLRELTFALLIGLALSLWMDMRHGWANLIRVDIAGIASFLFLVFFEFLFPQPKFEYMVSFQEAKQGISFSLLGLSGLVIGRHLVDIRGRETLRRMMPEVSYKQLVYFFWASFFIGYYHMLVAVNFNPIQMIDEMMGPRFSQPWGRGKYGSWGTLIYELGLIIHVLPAIGGYLITQRKIPPMHRFMILLVVALTLFKGFAGGTRNEFAAYLALFAAGYLLLQPRLTMKKLLITGGVVGVVFITASAHMLQFRQIGLHRYIDRGFQEQSESENFFTQSEDPSYFVDYNLAAICRIVDRMPEGYGFLGGEIYWWSLIKPIPRALWSTKPDGLSTSIEEVMGVEGLTISATFVGESYMAGGWIAVFLTGLGFGWLCALANKFRANANTTYGILVYASLFFPIILSMRSMIWFTTALLPTVALLAFGLYIRKNTPQARRPRMKPTAPLSHDTR